MKGFYNLLSQLRLYEKILLGVVVIAPYLAAVLIWADYKQLAIYLVNVGALPLVFGVRVHVAYLYAKFRGLLNDSKEETNQNIQDLLNNHVTPLKEDMTKIREAFDRIKSEFHEKAKDSIKIDRMERKILTDKGVLDSNISKIEGKLEILLLLNNSKFDQDQKNEEKKTRVKNQGSKKA